MTELYIVNIYLFNTKIGNSDLSFVLHKTYSQRSHKNKADTPQTTIKSKNNILSFFAT